VNIYKDNNGKFIPGEVLNSEKEAYFIAVHMSYPRIKVVKFTIDEE
jgi:hypothetical protein